MISQLQQVHGPYPSHATQLTTSGSVSVTHANTNVFVRQSILVKNLDSQMFLLFYLLIYITLFRGL